MSARILVVDDEPDVEALILQKFRQKIKDGAISFLFARDGIEALAALKANNGIDVVLTDINMPRMDIATDIPANPRSLLRRLDLAANGERSIHLEPWRDRKFYRRIK
jgi:CheY-like chemotaxis protein